MGWTSSLLAIFALSDDACCKDTSVVSCFVALFCLVMDELAGKEPQNRRT